MILAPQLKAQLLSPDVEYAARGMFNILHAMAGTVADHAPQPVPAETFRYGLALAIGARAQGPDFLLQKLHALGYLNWDRETDKVTLGARPFPNTAEEFEHENQR